MAKTSIEWATDSWNVVTGCTKVSQGCKHCYAETMAKRLKAMGRPEYQDVIGDDGKWNGTIQLVKERLEEPLKWKKPRRVFVNSMSDLFHESLHPTDIVPIFNVMYKAKQHTFLILTKRPDRMLDFASRLTYSNQFGFGNHLAVTGIYNKPASSVVLKNVWLGVSVEDQATADERIPILLRTPAAIRFVSYEPCLSSVNMLQWLQGDKHNEQSRTDISCIDCAGNVLDRRKGEYLEAQGAGGWEQGRITSDRKNSFGTTESRNREIARLSKNPTHLSWHTDQGLRSSNSLDDSESIGDPCRTANKSQERNKNGQCSEQPGTCDQSRKFDTCRANPENAWEERTKRGKKHKCEIDSGTDIGDPSAMGQSRIIAISNSPQIQRFPTNCSRDLHEKNMETPSLDWVICGGESGPGARPMHPDWARSVRDQCQAAGVPFFFKQWGEWALKGSVDMQSSDFGVLAPDGTWYHQHTGWNGRPIDPDTGEAFMVRIGKKAAGRMLDGRTWDEFPGGE